MSRFVTIGGKNNGRTHLPYRPTVNVQGLPNADRTAPLFTTIGLLVAAYFIVSMVWGL